ncbi:energy transducer TonB [Chryseobacterium sp. MEBOG06]|uniref:energy transducer TonB n=1 Tax=Chryseobacterium sp. MEBOG06 TaxID=2879938 RepID=UPI001F1E17C1|nr:energy transducer TonB [Chryseobacterium sp. MEBOG06]UKB83785.1 energy transducer TonB [Chryseobacterium sp. MEBOG06]
MKKYLLILPLLLLSGRGFSQEAKAQIQTQNGENFQKAEFPGGDDAFRKEFLNMVHAYIDVALYAIQGQVTFLFNINSKGKIDKVDILPRFRNDETFIDDMKFALKKVKGKWTPATKNGVPVDSKLIMKINFQNNVYDHD